MVLSAAGTFACGRAARATTSEGAARARERERKLDRRERGEGDGGRRVCVCRRSASGDCGAQGGCAVREGRATPKWRVEGQPLVAAGKTHEKDASAAPRPHRPTRKNLRPPVSTAGGRRGCMQDLSVPLHPCGPGHGGCAGAAAALRPSRGRARAGAARAGRFGRERGRQGRRRRRRGGRAAL